jgi:S-adenosylmethionine hydrolase
MRRIITLTTDFGTADHFVAVMKGIILGITPGVEIIDITHEIHPFEISEGAFVISETYQCFPKRTIHVVVVDPGVGSARRPILVEAAGQFFIGPDNGVLSMVYSREKSKVRVITAERLFRKPVSRTFHGRDIFAPCAAHLAKGATPAAFGKLIDDYLHVGFQKPNRTAKRSWSGIILKIDNFGNLITNFHVDDFPDLELRPFEMHVGVQTVSRLALNYADTAPGDIAIIVGSSGYFEVASNQGSAARALGCGVGAPVDLTVF